MRQEHINHDQTPPDHIIPSAYGIVLDRNGIDVAEQAATLFESIIQRYNQVGKELKDLKGEILTIPNVKLHFTGGWRNPERNEANGGSLTSKHQEGKGADLAPAASTPEESAILYWALWNALQEAAASGDLTGFWQLENSARVPILKSNDCLANIDEKLVEDDKENGIPDVVEQAAHLHIDSVVRQKVDSKTGKLSTCP